MKFLLLFCLFMLVLCGQRSGCFVVNSHQFDIEYTKYPTCINVSPSKLCYHPHPRVYIFQEISDAVDLCPYSSGIHNINSHDDIKSHMGVLLEDILKIKR